MADNKGESGTVELSSIKQPADIRALRAEECEDLADDIRMKIIQTVSKNGGHLSSNLGVVELTLALHRVFDTPNDLLVFDVGHQAYAHKLLTGRYEQFDTLRTYGGLSGFPQRHESPYDTFEVGHASTAISAALGYARARDARGEKHHVVAVVGDGALTGGMCYEALNDCGHTKTRLIVILNDNEMSIAKNVGALSHYLSNLRVSVGWNQAKRYTKKYLGKIPFVGKKLAGVVGGIKDALKSTVVDEGFFSALGFRYLGPINGNDQKAMERILRDAKNLDEPVLIHCITKKGYGYARAENKPEQFHGTPPFFVENGNVQSGGQKSNGAIASDALVELAKEDERIHVITAAMPLGTGTNRFEKHYPARFHDVGIAEEHAVTQSAGMAAGGLRPFFFVYSSFLQRGYDQVINDVCVQELPVTLMIDRSGIVNEDGRSHQGLYDIAYLRHMPKMTLLTPSSEQELKEMITEALRLNAPCAIRYSKGASTPDYVIEPKPFTIGKWQTVRKGQHCVLLAIGSMVESALQVASILSGEEIECQVINASTLKPLDGACLETCFAKDIPIFTMEEHCLMGGFGSAVLEYAAMHGHFANIRPMGVQDQFVPHGDHQHLLSDLGLSNDQMAKTIRETLQKTIKQEHHHE